MSYWTGHMNYIKRVFHNPCSTPDPTVLIETALQALVPQIVAFNTMTCNDIVKAKAGISWKCGRMIKAANSQAIGPKAASANHFLYGMTMASAYRGLYYYFVAQQAQEFVADWMSLIYASQGCDLPIEGHFETQITPGVNSDGQRTVHSFGTGTCAGITVGGNVIHVPPGVEADIMFSVRARPAPWNHNSSWSIQTSLQNVGSQKVLAAGAASSDHGPVVAAQNFARATSETLHFFGEDFELSTTTTGGDISYYEGDLQITGRGHPVIPVPVNLCAAMANKRVGEFLDWMNGTTHGPH